MLLTVVAQPCGKMRGHLSSFNVEIAVERKTCLLQTLVRPNSYKWKLCNLQNKAYY